MNTSSTPILVVTTSSRLQETLIDILEPEFHCEFIQSVSQAESILKETKINAAILDFNAAVTENGINILNRIDPSLAHVVVCPKDNREDFLATDLSNRVFRFMFTPLSKGQTKLAIQSADSFGKTKTAELNEQSSSKLIPLLSLIAVTVLASGYYFTTKSPAPLPEQQLSEDIVQLTAAQENFIRELNIQASNAEELSNFYPPKSDNAVSNYLEILKVNPQDANALSSLERLAKQSLGDLELHLNNASINDALSAITNAEELQTYDDDFGSYIQQALDNQKLDFINTVLVAQTEGRYADALIAIETANQVYPNDERILTVFNEIQDDKANFDKAARINELVNEITNAINNNRLLTPTNRNALFYINSLESLDPNNPSLVILKNDFASSALEASRSATDNKQFANAKRLLDTAQTLAGSSSELQTELTRINNLESEFLASEQERIQLEQEERELERQRQAQLEAAAALDAANAQAAAEITANNVSSTRNTSSTSTFERREENINPVPAQPEPEPEPEITVNLNEPVKRRFSELTIREQTQAKYPNRYLRNGTTGQALVSFTVNRDGTTSNVEAIEITPSRARDFGPAAESAVEKWIFEPYQDENGNIRIVNSSIAITFEL